MACLQSFEPLLGGPPASKDSSYSLKEDCVSHSNTNIISSSNDVVESAASQRRMWVERQGNSSHRTFIAPGDRYEMVSVYRFQHYLQCIMAV